MEDNYVVLDGTRYKIEDVEDRDTFAVVDGVVYGSLALAVSYPSTEETA